MSTIEQRAAKLQAEKLFWKNATESPTLSNDLSIVDPTNYDRQKLANWIKTFYASDHQYDIYQLMTTEAIKRSNLPAVQLLWKAIYHFDSSNPHYYLDLATAAEYANLNTFLYVLKGFTSSARVWEDDETYTVADLGLLAANNPDAKVHQHILTLGDPTTIIQHK